MSPSEYYEMTWYDFNLVIMRHEQKMLIKNADFENGWNQTRQIWAMIANTAIRSSAKVFEGKDLITLSFDKESLTEMSPSMTKEKMEQLKKRFGSTIKNKKKRGK